MLRVVRLVAQLGNLVRLGDLQALQLTPHDPHITQEHLHGVAGSHAVLDDRGEVLIPVIQAIFVIVVNLTIVGVFGPQECRAEDTNQLGFEERVVGERLLHLLLPVLIDVMALLGVPLANATHLILVRVALHVQASIAPEGRSVARLVGIEVREAHGGHERAAAFYPLQRRHPTSDVP